MPYQPDQKLATFIQNLPKTETHLHLEGALPYHLLQELNPDRYKDFPSSWDDDYKFLSFQQFEDELISMAIEWYTTAERYHEAAKIIFKNHQNQNVKYVETSFHAGIVEFIDSSGPEIIAAIRDAVPEGLAVKIFMGMLRNQYNDKMGSVIEECITWEGLDGIDLHGQEPLPIEDWTKRIWPAARDNGKFTKAHAGEFGGPNYVREAIELLGVSRIQHGINAVNDKQLLEFIKERDITFDVCPISNVKLDVVPNMAGHPIKELLDIGVRCTISTDDPLSFGNSLNEEYAALAIDLSFTQKELAQVARNGFEVALMSEEFKNTYLKELDQVISNC